MNLRTIAPAFAALLAAGSLAASAQATELLVNGNFETGDFTGWTATNQAGGDQNGWIVRPNDGTSAPILAGGGNFFANTEQGGPGSHSLSQAFTATAGGLYILNFDARADDQSGQAPVGEGLDYNTQPNQHLEVNIFGPANTLVFTGLFSSGWAHHTFDVSNAITSSGLYSLSFGEVDNQLFFHEGLDNVSLDGTAGVPEPTSWALMLTGFAGLGAMLRSRRRVALAA